MTIPQDCLPTLNVMPELPENVANVVDPRSTIHNTSNLPQAFDSKYSSYTSGSDFDHSNNLETSEDIKPPVSPVTVTWGAYWNMLRDSSHVEGGAFGVSKEEGNEEEELEMEPGLEGADEGEENVEGGEDEEETQGNDATDTKNTASKSERQHEVSHNSTPSSPKRALGNNPYGSRGCLSCVSCRRRKGRVFHSFLRL
jgi:hypothetical protein